MTATVSADVRHDVLSNRLAALYVEREQVLGEITPTGFGDEADRATNVDGHIRLAMLEQRIVDLENELAEPIPAPGNDTAADAVVVGSLVTVDLGDGPESYLVGSVDEAGAGYDVITPSSPLGKALLGSRAGATLTYSPRPGRSLTAKVLSIG